MTSLSPYTQIYTPDGIKNAFSVMEGELVYGGGGKLTRVSDVSYSVEEDAEIEFANGFVIETSKDSDFIYQRGNNIAYDLERKGWICNPMETIAREMGKYNRFISEMPVATEEVDSFTECDPYLLGLWLGDGSKANASVACSGADLEHVKSRIAKGGYEVGSVLKDKRADVYQVIIKNGFKTSLRRLGLLHNKAIPRDFIRYSVEDRVELIRGLVDSDGTIESQRGRAIFTNTNKCIVDELVGLLSSIGESACCTKRICRGFGKECECYFVQWTPIMNPAHLPRKAERFRGRRVLCNRGIHNVRFFGSKSDKVKITTESGTLLVGRHLIKVRAGK